MIDLSRNTQSGEVGLTAVDHSVLDFPFVIRNPLWHFYPDMVNLFWGAKTIKGLFQNVLIGYFAIDGQQQDPQAICMVAKLLMRDL